MNIVDVEIHYRLNFDKVVNRVVGRVPDNSRHIAEEVVQDAYERVIKYLNTYKPGEHGFEAWFNRILNNCVNSCRSSERDKGVVRVEESRGDSVVQISNITANEAVHIFNLMRGYTKEDRRILSLYFFEGLSSRGIAECTGRSHGAIRIFLHRFSNSVKEER